MNDGVQRVAMNDGVQRVAMNDGVQLSTWTSGRATEHPPVLLVHGGPGLWDNLGPVAELLADVTLVHRFDQRGCGDSDGSDEQSIARSLADIEVLRQHWGHRSWAVIGHSFGASLAFAYAAQHPTSTAAR